MLNRTEKLYKPTQTTLILLLLALVGSAGLGLLVGTKFGSLRWGIDDSISLVIMTTVAMTILIVSFTTNRIDKFSPLVMFALAFIVQYSIPGFMLVTSGNSAIRSGVPFYEFGRSMTVVVIAFFGGLAGYFGYRQSGTWRGLTKPKYYLDVIHMAPKRTAFFVTLTILVTFLGLFVAWIVVGGVSISQLNALADDSGYGAAARSATTNLVFLLKSLRSWPLLFFLTAAFIPNSRWRVPIGVLWLLIFLISLGTGSRTAPILFLGIQVIYFYLRTHRRPTALALAAGLVFVMLTSGTLVLLRSPNVQEMSLEFVINDAQREILDRGPTYGLMNITYVFPDHHTYLGMRIFRDIIVMPIPRALWPGKPILISQNAIVEPLLPIPDAHSAGLIGVYYAHFGYFGAFFSFFFLGYISAMIFSLYESRPDDNITQILLAGLLPSIYILMIRSNPTAQVTYVAYFFGPFFLALFIIYRKVHRQVKVAAQSRFWRTTSALTSAD